ncbi:MAG: helix-turn-helix domain-containing protein [Actinomycetota bacterium]
MSLRARHRRNTAAVTQRAAVDLFAAEGFDAVTVRDVCAAVGMAPSTLYRHFPSKEAIVVWDEHAEDDGAAIERALERWPPFAALRHSFVADVAARYDDDGGFQLRRISLIYRTPTIHAAAIRADADDRVYLTDLLARHLSVEQRDGADLLAGAALLAADRALDRWQAAAAATPLVELMTAAFDRLAHLERLR